jgi:hypothetical protein
MEQNMTAGEDKKCIVDAVLCTDRQGFLQELSEFCPALLQ